MSSLMNLYLLHEGLIDPLLIAVSFGIILVVMAGMGLYILYDYIKHRLKKGKHGD